LGKCNAVREIKEKKVGFSIIRSLIPGWMVSLECDFNVLDQYGTYR
jgi:hypothetical protein